MLDFRLNQLVRWSSFQRGGTFGEEGLLSMTRIRDEAILYLDEDYCVLNKPANLRMDGPSDNTVEKNLHSWFSSQQDEAQKLRFHPSGIPPLKWIHQLDYATSGALCVGLNRSAASKASTSFEQREVSKEYIAVVEGHVDLSKWPLLSQKQVKPLIGRPVNDKDKHNKRNNEETSISHNAPGQSKWQEVVMIHNLTKCFVILVTITNRYEAIVGTNNSSVLNSSVLNSTSSDRCTVHSRARHAQHEQCEHEHEQQFQYTEAIEKLLQDQSAVVYTLYTLYTIYTLYIYYI